MAAVDMCRRLAVVVFVVVCVSFIPTLSVGGSDNVVNFDIHASSSREAINAVFTDEHLQRKKRDASDDERCKKRENTFLSELKSGKRIETQWTFANKTHFSLAMAWASDNDEGVLIVVTTEVVLMMFATSNVWRSTNYGRHWVNIDNKINNDVINKHNGVQRNPHSAKIVYLISYHDFVYVTEDGGETFNKRKVVDADTVLESPLIFHPDNQQGSVMVIASDRKLFATTNNFVDKRKVADNVVSAKWSTKDLKEPDAIYALVGSDSDRNPFFGHVRTYSLVKYTNKESNTPSTLRTNVIAFGIQGGFLYASVYTKSNPSQDTPKLMIVSVDAGKTWNEAQLPTLAGDRFFSVMDMSEHLIFMHVDNPGDTGSGTLYTSAQTGVVYSESLQHHLYPNYGSVTDFYKVESMRGVYLASQLNDDKSIHTVITFDRGGVWQPIVPPQENCKDPSKACQLQIHNYYSISRGVKARPPLSTENAPGLVLVHGHAADALQTTEPDVYITTDGGYSWRKTLDGPHHYQIGDSGGLLVAVSTSEATPNTIKFSTDEGACWHTYQFTNESIYFTGLLTEPGGKSMTVSIWGYTANTDRKWIVNVINFAEVITRNCDDSDYVKWQPHSQMRRMENKDVEGCLLGVRETFMKLKPESWCRNGYDKDFEKQIDICKCTREDYECDYSYYRPPSSDDCVKQPEFTGKDVDICLRGHEETIVSEGYRKIPGDKCMGGVAFSKVRMIDLTVTCAAGTKELIIEMETPTKLPSHTALISVIIGTVVLLLLGVTSYFIYKMYLLRKHRVVYRYSMLNQSDPETYDNELENALSAHTLYEDSDDESLPKNLPDMNYANGTTVKSHVSSKPNKVKSFHDDSDDDLLE